MTFVSRDEWRAILRKGLCILFPCHLALVICGAAKIDLANHIGTIGHVLKTYQAYTGSDNSYGFFAPGVAAERRLILHIYSEGAWNTLVESFLNHETDLRVKTIVGLTRHEDYRELIAASWAARGLAYFPAASIVMVEMQYYFVPAVDQFRNGQRPEWRPEVFLNFTIFDRALNELE